ncbi:hypothetical protein [Streptomyces chartreusis]|uniref:hypothetical protein n=1 Tax=Streptomyces chartreusis TaxID=1969 RepID=UPI0038186657
MGFNFSTEAGNRAAADAALQDAEAARQAGDAARAAEREGFASEALRQAEYSKQLGR